MSKLLAVTGSFSVQPLLLLFSDTLDNYSRQDS